MTPTDKRPSRLSWTWRLAASLACAVAVQGCGGLTVLPTSPSGGPSPSATPQTIAFRGTLSDGGSFEGFVTYGTRDIDDRPTFGRYRGGTWDLVVRGGTATHDLHLSNEGGGRAVIETYTTPFPAIGVVVLWPEEDPAVQSFTPHVTPAAGYDPDVQPLLRDFGALIPGQFERAFGIFDDGQGGRALVTTFDVH